MEDTQCPICRTRHGSKCRLIESPGYDGKKFDCDSCGAFAASESVLAGKIRPEANLTLVQRAAISHRLRIASDSGAPRTLYDDEWLRSVLREPFLPTPAVQAANLLRFVGDYVRRTGEKVPGLQPALASIVGAASAELAGGIALELMNRGLLAGIDRVTFGSPPDLMNVNLTLGGWEAYEAERRGKVAGRYGFMALKFGDSVLDGLLEGTIKPRIRDQIGFEVVDMRDVARAGLIDNIMRAQIRDAAFVIVDLTHDNSGAYWEAGYAEGLGKPVIYICEQKKFDDARTHFDTNHCTTVVWSLSAIDRFAEQLVATLRRSLDLFGR